MAASSLTSLFIFLLLSSALVAVVLSSPIATATVKLQSLRNTTMVVDMVEESDAVNEHAVADPEEVVAMVHMSIHNSTQRRNLGYFSCGTGNPIDDCWRCDPHWHKNRKRLADCAIGFGRNAIGGRNGRFYVVTDPSDHDAVNPRPGTLRHAVIQEEPLWIVFQRDMVIRLKEELIMNSFKTIDGRGVNVHIANGACITVQYVTNIIIHGIHIHDCKPTGNAMVRSSTTHFGWRTMADGDGISLFGASHVWIDHNSLSHCADGLVDAIMGSTAITISNNHFAHHNEVESEKMDDLKPKEASDFKAAEEVEGGVVLWKGRPIHEVDPDEVFADSDPDGDEGTIESSEATFTWSRRGYRGYKHCYLNDDGDYVRYVEADGTEVLYSGSLDSDSAWNRQWCKRVKPEVISSDDSDEVSSRPPAKKPKSGAT